MNYDYSELNGKIVACFGTRSCFAKAMELSERSISLKLNNKRAWTQPEMQKAIVLFNEPYSKIKDYFFKFNVQNN